MDSSGAQHYQEMSQNSVDRKTRPQPEHALKCPRCDSTNTKFCYYNNYSLSQPRYFCKSCRRYWTKGGTLRNVPVGGGCRKNKRSSSSSSKIRTPDHQQPEMGHHNNPLSGFSNPLINYDSHDLTLAFARLQKQANLGFDNNDPDNLSILGNRSDSFYGNPISNNCSAECPELLDAIRGNFLESHHNHVHAAGGNFQNLYYGFGNSNVTTTHHLEGEVQNGAGLNGVDKVLWGFPWQINGGDGGNMTTSLVDSGRESWNGFGGAAAAPWHGLLNSPLM